MARLISKSVFLEILPLKPQFEEEEKGWIQTHFLLELKVPGQRLIIQPSENLFILYDNFTFFLKGVRQFIQKLQHIPEDTDPITDSIKPFEFVPLELDFKFALLDGEVSSEEEGEITVQIMANLEMINSSLSSEYIGSERPST